MKKLIVLAACAAATAALADEGAADTNRLEASSKFATLVFDTELAPDLRGWTEKTFMPTMREWVVRLEDVMSSDGWAPPTNILFKFVVERLAHDTNAMAWAMTTKSAVSLRVDWFRENLDGEALGATVHELVHVMQGYWTSGCNRKNCPSWAVEGYADYVRWYLFEPESDGCSYARKCPDRCRYNDSYRVTASFFDFVERHFPGTVKRLNAALRDHSFDNDVFWTDETGMKAEDLEAHWKAENAAVEAALRLDARKKAKKAAK